MGCFERADRVRWIRRLLPVVLMATHPQERSNGRLFRRQDEDRGGGPEEKAVICIAGKEGSEMFKYHIPDISFSHGMIIAYCTIYEPSFYLHLCRTFASRTGTTTFRDNSIFQTETPIRMLAKMISIFLPYVCNSFILLYRKPKPPHATPILIHHALAILLRIITIGEQHAFVASGFLVFADTAGLFRSSV